MEAKLKEKLIKQVSIELESAYKYQALSSFFASRSLTGFASWMRVQAEEEVAHADKIHQFLLDLGIDVTFDSLAAPKAEFESYRSAFEHALAQEKLLKDIFEEMSELAKNSSDNTAYHFIEWFLTEQVEEIATVQEVIDRLTIAGEDGYGLLMIDKELGERKPEEAPA